MQPKPCPEGPLLLCKEWRGYGPKCVIRWLVQMQPQMEIIACVGSPRLSAIQESKMHQLRSRLSLTQGLITLLRTSTLATSKTWNLKGPRGRLLSSGRTIGPNVHQKTHYHRPQIVRTTRTLPSQPMFLRLQQVPAQLGLQQHPAQL